MRYFFSHLAYATLLLLVTVSGALAQKNGTGRISGKVTDKANGRTLEGVTLSIVSQQDSVLVDYTSSTTTGSFRLTGLPVGRPLEMFITRKGYSDTAFVFQLSPGRPFIDSITLAISVQPIALKGVNITASRAPFSYRNDTLEFNATSYKLMPNATVKQLLLTLPGVLLDDAGNITVNGKKLSQIQLEGRDFFSGDLNASIDNLPGDIIEKIQVTTRKSLEERRSLAMNQRKDEVAINLTLKKDKKQGVVGNAAVGAGTEGRYIANGTATFLGPLRLSLYANAGNAPADGRSRYYGGYDNGITDRTSAGLSINTDLSKKIRLDANYGMGISKTERSKQSDRINFLPDSSFIYKSDNQGTARSQYHNLNTSINYEADSLTSWNWRLGVDWNSNKNTSTTTAASQRMDSSILNTMSSRVQNEMKGARISNSLSFNKTSRNRNVNLNMEYRNSFGKDDGSDNNGSLNTFYNAPDQVINQQSKIDGKNVSHGLSFNLSSRLGDHIMLAGRYNMTYSSSENSKATFNFDPATGKYSSRDSILSNDVHNTNLSHAPGLQIGYHSKTFNVALNGGWLFSEQRNRLPLLDSVLEIDQQQFTPSLTLNYQFDKGQLYAEYAVNSVAPTPEQLTAIPDNSNPLYIRVGNPDLKAGLFHRFNANLDFFRPERGWYVSFNTSGELMNNKIVEDISYDSLRRQVVSWRNVDGNQAWRAMGTFSKSKKKATWNRSYGTSLRANYQNDAGLLSGELNNALSWQLGASFFASVGWKELATLRASYSYTWRKSTNSINSLPGTEFGVSAYSTMLEMRPLKRMELIGDFNYRYNGQLPEEMGRRVKMLNASVGYRFLKREQLTLFLDVYDLFNESRSVSRVVTATYTENSTSMVLRRFVLLRLKYNFNQLGGAVGAEPMRAL